MKDSVFYTLAKDAIKKEIEKLEIFCENLDKNPALKKEQIAEYKCAKYRYAGASTVYTMLYNCNRLKRLIPYVEELFLKNSKYTEICNSTPESEKYDFRLYYGVLAFAESKIYELEKKLPLASDWESIELSERLGGLKFSASCLSEAWEKRGE